MVAGLDGGAFSRDRDGLSAAFVPGRAVQDSVGIDVADAAAVSAWLTAYVAQNWPPIRGVVHAAGVADERLTVDLDLKAVTAVMDGKAQGALNLDRLLPELDLFLVVSSMAAVFPHPGQSAYAAANAALDALALRR